MVKHQKEKLYQSAREHRANSQLRAGPSSASNSSSSITRRLPFNCCALTLNPIQNPVCTPNGILFENNAIIPYLLKYKKDPVTGEPMSTRDIIVLNMDKNEETGAWQCPVLCKTFTEYSKVVAIRQRPSAANEHRNEANVYAYEAVDELNFKTKHYVDLTSGQNFSKATDVMMLLDPNDDNLAKLRDINNFKHTKMLREDKKQKDLENKNENVRHSVTAHRIMEKLNNNKRKKEQELKELEKQKKLKDDSSGKPKILIDDVFTGVKMTTGKCSGSFTSTSMEITHDNTSREATMDEILDARFNVMKKMKKKGYIRLVTNMGDMDIELHCDIAPRTTTNFLGLAEAGKYNGSIFHRSIRDFMIQGGKPKKKGDAEESTWGKEPFKDEFDDRLTHSAKGVLSMANSGPNTNKCQFFITFKSCNHLDRKHSVFGTVIRGLDVLSLIENVPTDKNTDKPVQKIQILSTIILVNPAKEAEEAERIRIEESIVERERLKESRKAAALGKNIKSKHKSSNSSSRKGKSKKEDNMGIGKYLPKNVFKSLEEQDTQYSVEVSNKEQTSISRLPPPPKKTTFGDFSSW